MYDERVDNIIIISMNRIMSPKQQFRGISIFEHDVSSRIHKPFLFCLLSLQVTFVEFRVGLLCGLNTSLAELLVAFIHILWIRKYQKYLGIGIRIVFKLELLPHQTFVRIIYYITSI